LGSADLRLQGGIRVSTPAGRYLVSPNRAVWVPPKIPHEVASSCGAQLSSVYIAADEATQLNASCYVLEVSNLLHELIIEALTQPVNYQWAGQTGRMFRTLRDQIIVAKAAPLHLPLPNDSRLLKVCAELQRKPHSNRSLEQWGSYAGASSRTLQRLFLKETGLRFNPWRQQLRLQIALQRLAGGDDSVTTIAAELGYASSSAFITMFRNKWVAHHANTQNRWLKITAKFGFIRRSLEITILRKLSLLPSEELGCLRAFHNHHAGSCQHSTLVG